MAANAEESLLGPASVSTIPGCYTMNSSEVPAPLQQSYDNLVCELCYVQCDSLKSLNAHYFELGHKIRSRNLAKCLFGYIPAKRDYIRCFDDMFSPLKKNGPYIGMHYLKECSRGEQTKFACGLCDVACTTMFQHIVSYKHKKNYIDRHFQFILKDNDSFYPPVMETIAAVIEQVEGLQKFKEALKNPTKSAQDLDSSFRQTLDKVVEQLQMRGIACENPYSHPNERENLVVLKPTPPKPFAAAQNTSRQGQDIEKRQNQGIDYKDNYKKEKVVSYQQAGLHASGTNEKNNINTSVRLKSPVASNITSKQVDDKQQNHRVVSKDTCRNENAVPSLQTGTRASAINEKGAKRPLQFEPLEDFKRSKSELTSQFVGKPIISLSRPVPAPFSFPVPSGGVIGGSNMPGYNTPPATKLQTTSYVPPVNDGFTLKHTPSLWSSHSGSWFHQTNQPPAGSHFPSWPPDVPFHQSAVQGYGYYSDPRFRGFTNESAYGQASSVSDVGKASAFKNDTWRRETGPPGAQHLHTLGTMGGSVSSLTGPTSSVAALKQEPSSSYNHISVDSKELLSKSSSPPGVRSVLSKEPSLPKSHQDSPPSEGLPPASTGSRAQTSQNTNLDMPVKAASVLSPHTLKVLQGREPKSVKSILKRLSEYCPELKEVNISLLVDVLFQTGALH